MGVIYESYVDLLDNPSDEYAKNKPNKQLLVTPHPSKVG
jgi:hypothetical protein